MVLRPGQCGDLALVAELSLGKAPDSLARATASALVRVWIITCREGRLADAQYSKRAIFISRRTERCESVHPDPVSSRVDQNGRHGAVLERVSVVRR